MTLRELFINWLTASRFIDSLEQRHIEQRHDFQRQLGEKDELIKVLRTEIAALRLECDRMRSVLMPFGSAAGAVYAQRFLQDRTERPAQVPQFTGPDSWDAELIRMYASEAKETEDGVQKQ